MTYSAGYDTIEGIQKYLTNLDGLRQLKFDRSQAGYKRNERMNEFLVLGRFYLDSCGNFSLCIKIENPAYEDVGWISDAIPKVLLFREFLTTVNLSITSQMYRLPRPGDVCVECGEGWDLSNCHDSEVIHGDGDSFTFEHAYCHKLGVERMAMQEHRDLAEKAGLGKMVLVPVKNEYDGYYGPWCLMKTPKGDIKFGWRKRVINIDWSDVVKRKLKAVKFGLDGYKEKEAIQEKFNANTLFPSEDVTKDGHLIHAWGEEKCIEYLRKLSEVIGIGDFKKSLVVHDPVPD
jgi:hypothetical protein